MLIVAPAPIRDSHRATGAPCWNAIFVRIPCQIPCHDGIGREKRPVPPRDPRRVSVRARTRYGDAPMTLTAFRAELLSVPDDPRAGAAPLHHEDGLLVVADGIVVAFGAYADLAPRYPGVAVERLAGLVVPGFVDTHIHYPQTDRIAAHGAQLLDWLDRHIFTEEARFADRAHADAVAGFFLDELLRNGTTTAMVFGSVHRASIDALFEVALARNMRLIAGKSLMDQGPDGLKDTVASGRDETEGLIGAKMIRSTFRRDKNPNHLTPTRPILSNPMNHFDLKNGVLHAENVALPEFAAGGKFDEITVRDLLDMKSGIDVTEDYSEYKPFTGVAGLQVQPRGSHTQEK
eukprot:gene40002-54084_t